MLCKQRQLVNYPTHLMQNDVHIRSKQNTCMANEFNRVRVNPNPKIHVWLMSLIGLGLTLTLKYMYG